MSKLAFIFSVVLMLSTATIAAGDASSGKAKVAVCAACHGADGNSAVATFPKLAGQSAVYLLKQLKDYKSGARKDPSMVAMVGSFNNQDMLDISAYYASQSVIQGVAKADLDTVKLGERLYRGGKKDTQTIACIACHGPQGKGIPSAGFPALASQHATYTIAQLKAFRQDALNQQMGTALPARVNDYESMMRSTTKHLTTREINAVAQYLSGLH